MPLNHNTKYSHLPDAELLRMYATTGNNEWLGEALARHSLLMLGVALKYLKNSADAEDAVQQIMVKALTNFPEQPIENFKGWLYILLRNHCLSTLRSSQHLVPIEDLPLTASNTTAQVAEKEHSLQQLEAAITKLDDAQRQCITRFYLQKSSYQEIMDVTGYSFAQVKSYIQNGKRNLRNLLNSPQH